MASTSKSAAILCQVFLALAFLLAVCSARDSIDKNNDMAMAPSEGPYRPTPSPSKPSPSTGSICNKAYSVKKGDTCYAVMQMFKLKETNFYQINPNVVCNHLFVGQWLCIKAGGSGN